MSQTRWFTFTRTALILGIFAALIVLIGGLPGSVAAAPACGAECYVNAVTGFDSNDGTADNPFATIQYAIDNVSDGGTVHVAAGTYEEQVTIAKSLTLVGDSSATTIINAPSNLPPVNYDHDNDPNTAKVPNPDSYIMKIAGTGVAAEVSKFTISGPGPGSCGSIAFGILVRDSAHANIHDNKIIDVMGNAPW